MRPAGPIRLLTHLRYFGYCMNPVSFYYCFDAAGTALETIVAEITNTPWRERHQYVLPVAERRRALRFEFDKDFHVSPFMPMEMQYRLALQRTRGSGCSCTCRISRTGNACSTPPWRSKGGRSPPRRWC